MNIGSRVQVSDKVEYGAMSYRGMKGIITQEEGMGLVVVKLDSGEVSAFWLKELRLIGHKRNLPEWF